MRDDIDEIGAAHAIVAAAAVIEEGQALAHCPEDIAADAHAAAEQAYELYLHMAAHADADDAQAASHAMTTVGRGKGAGHPASKRHQMKPLNPHPSRGGPGQGLGGIYGQAQAKLLDAQASSVGAPRGGGHGGGHHGGGGGHGRMGPGARARSTPSAPLPFKAGLPASHGSGGVFGGGGPPIGHLPFGGGGGGTPHGPPLGHLPFGGGGGGAPPPVAHPPFGSPPVPAPHPPGPPFGGGGGGFPPGPPWHGHGHPHGGFGLGFGGGGWGYGGPEVIDVNLDVESPCPPGMVLDQLDDGSVACVPDCPPGSHLEQLADGSLACIPDVVVGHGGGGGGGHGGGGNFGGHGGHGGWGGRHRGGCFGGGGWGGYGYGYPYWPIVLACGPGQVMLADGSCVPAVGPVTVGAPMPEGDGWEGGDPVACGIDEDGTVTLPDGTTVNAHDLDWSGIESTFHNRGAQHHRHHDVPLVGHTMVGDSTSDFPPFTGETTMPAAVATGPNAQQSATADAINANWVALSQMVANNPTTIGPNPTLPSSWAPLFDSTLWLDDWNNWQAYYAAIGTLAFSQLESLNSWQDYANAWGSYFRSLAPNAPLPQNYPVTVVTPTTLPSLSSASPTANLIEWAVIATCIGVGLWVLWPVLAGAHGALAAA